MESSYITLKHILYPGMAFPQCGIPIDSVVPVWILTGGYGDAQSGCQISAFYDNYSAYAMLKEAGYE